MSRRKVLFFVSIILLGVGLLLLWQQHRMRPPGITKTSLRLKWIVNAGFAGDFVALEKGFWREQGIDVEVRPGGLGNDPIKLVAAGTDDFGLATGDQILLARAQEIPVVAIGLVYQRNPLTFMVHSDSGISHPRDFVGRTVGLTYTDDEPLYSAMMRKLGVRRDKVTEVRVQFDLGPFLQRKVDAFPAFINTQAVEVQEKGTKINTISPADYGIVAYSNLYFTRENLIANNPELVQRFLVGAIKGWRFALDHPDESVQYVLRHGDGLNISVESKSLQATLQLLRPNSSIQVGSMTKEGWESTQQVLLDQGILKQRRDVSKVFTTTFLQKVYRQGGP